jgi:hypothetical protein
MFKSVSWSSFITTLVVLLAIYYIVIAVLYFRDDVMSLLKRKEKPAPSSSPEPQNRGSMFSSVHELMDELKELFFTAASRHYPEEELVMALQSTLKRYSNLKDTQFEAAINNDIQQSALSMCNISLDESDLKRVW